MNEASKPLLYVLTPNLGRPAGSVGVKRYSALMKSSGTFGDADLQEALAKESVAKVEFFHYLEQLRCGGQSCRGRLPIRGVVAVRTLSARRRDALRAWRRVPCP